MLISKRNGSYFFISELITEIELEYDQPMGGNYCGDCSRCMDACPTGAITDLRVVDASKCISYLTIENKGEIPSVATIFPFDSNKPAFRAILVARVAIAGEVASLSSTSTQSTTLAGMEATDSVPV